jgi:glucosamine-6-phosphate deaminase
MPRPISKVAADWWDYTTLDAQLLADAAKLTERDLVQLARPGFTVHLYDTLEELFTAEALEYVESWRQSTPDNPAGICGPIGPTEQLPLVARIVNSLGLNLGKLDAHFWGMDEWVQDGKAVPPTHPLSFVKADRDLCFDRIKPELKMPEKNQHFPIGDLEAYSRSYDGIRCVVMQGGQGDVKHWAFNDPPRRTGKYANEPMPVAEYRKLKTRLTDLHPLTVIQNARTNGAGNIPAVPTQAHTVGPAETWKAERVSIWHPGYHDNPFGIRLTALMISKRLPDTSVPMSLLADHPNVHFHYWRKNIGKVETGFGT